MKLEFWHKDMIRFMTDASEYGDYYRQLTGQMRPWLSADMHICERNASVCSALAKSQAMITSLFFMLCLLFDLFYNSDNVR